MHRYLALLMPSHFTDFCILLRPLSAGSWCSESRDLTPSSSQCRSKSSHHAEGLRIELLGATLSLVQRLPQKLHLHMRAPGRGKLAHCGCWPCVLQSEAPMKGRGKQTNTYFSFADGSLCTSCCRAGRHGGTKANMRSSRAFGSVNESFAKFVQGGLPSRSYPTGTTIAHDRNST